MSEQQQSQPSKRAQKKLQQQQKASQSQQPASQQPGQNEPSQSQQKPPQPQQKPVQPKQEPQQQKQQIKSQQPPARIPLLDKIPVKPVRTKPAPGQVVRLITNLFRLQLKLGKKVIYSFTINVDELKTTDDKGDVAKKGGAPAAPRKLPRAIKHAVICKAIEDWVNRTNPRDFNRDLEFNYVIDNSGSMMYALFNMFPNIAKPDSKSSLTFDIEHEERNFAVKINNVGPLNIGDFVDYCQRKGIPNSSSVQDHERALGTILQGKIYTIDRFVVMQGKTGISTVFPYEREKQFEISPGVICNRGYQLSVRPTESGIVLNVANTVAPFYKAISLIDFLKERYRVVDFSRPLHPGVVSELEKELKNKQVEVKHISYNGHYKKHRIEFINGCAKTDKFTLVDKTTKTSKEVTVEQYFNKEYPQHRLKYPNLPCIVDKGRRLPLEVCRLVDKQRVARKLDGKETANVITQAALRPPEHFKNVRENVAQVKELSQPLQDFGLELDPRPIEVDGREIQPLALVGNTGREITPNNGEYFAREKFVQPVRVGKYAVAFIVDSYVSRDLQQGLEQNTRNTFLSNYCRYAGEKGILIQPNTGAVDFLPGKESTIDRMSEPDLKALLRKYMFHLNQSKFDHAIIVLPERCPDFVYGYLQYLETSVSGAGRKPGEKWTRTSCVKYSNFTKKILYDQRFGGSMFISNLWLKYNTKLGGVNFTLSPRNNFNFLKDGWIFISIDVCHPAPGDRLTQSIAAVVGMWDITGKNMSFCTRIKAQRKERSKDDKSTVEEVLEIDVMVSEVIESYRLRKNKLPTHIVMLRDGVSEGQFIMVSNNELGKVITSLRTKYQMSKMNPPLVSCVIIQKRHKIRLMRKEPVQTKKGPDFNIQPGTVVDNTITRPNEFSFYIAPHKAIQGTSRAPYAFFIYDEIKFDQDTAQTMIHSLSYLSPRCNKSTSIPTPVNLADLAAERGKNIVVSWNSDNPRVPEAERFRRLNEFLSNGLADENYKNTLYYV